MDPIIDNRNPTTPTSPPALVVGVRDQVVRLARAHLATIQEADPALAEYLK